VSSASGVDGELAIHTWHIEEREYRRQEQRRGRRHAYRHIDATRTALVVVDMVPFFALENPYCRGIVPNINRVAARLRRAGGVVSWVLPGDPGASPVMEEFHGRHVADLYRHSGGDGALPSRLWPELEVEDADLLVEKTASSAFFPGRSPLPELLSARGIDTVVIAGTVTNVCCESSARDASTLGYRVIFLADANAARRDQDHNATLYTIYRTFGDVRSTSEVIDLIAVDA
jgi:nicotinamidase-related amidase